MKRIRSVSEAEVIAEFLKNEFYQEEFHRDRERFEDLVLKANTHDDIENTLRRALLFRRRGHLWREVPRDTEWTEVELSPAELQSLRVFPRAQWRKVANGSFRVGDIVERIRSRSVSGRVADFIAKIHSLNYRLRLEPVSDAIILIGVNQDEPVTVIEGNHRLTAALMTSPNLAQRRFRFYLGLSLRMTESCWYVTNLATLARYAKNRFRHFWYDSEADVDRLLRRLTRERQPELARVVSAQKAFPESSPK